MLVLTRPRSKLSQLEDSQVESMLTGLLSTDLEQHSRRVEQVSASPGGCGASHGHVRIDPARLHNGLSSLWALLQVRAAELGLLLPGNNYQTHFRQRWRHWPRPASPVYSQVPASTTSNL